MRPTVPAATEALATHLDRLKAAYGSHEERRALQLDARTSLTGTSPPLDLDALARWAGDAVAGEERA